MSNIKKEEALIALGSNLGDRSVNLHTAWRRLGETPGVRLQALSSFYETKPVGGQPDQPDYLNAAGLLETTLGAEELLAALLKIEALGGRVRSERWGARTIDLDLLLYGDLQISSETLTVPHPRMTERRFVLEPAAEIAPRIIHPASGKTIAALLAGLPADSAAARPANSAAEI